MAKLEPPMKEMTQAAIFTARRRLPALFGRDGLRWGVPVLILAVVFSGSDIGLLVRDTLAEAYLQVSMPRRVVCEGGLEMPSRIPDNCQSLTLVTFGPGALSVCPQNSANIPQNSANFREHLAKFRKHSTQIRKTPQISAKIRKIPKQKKRKTSSKIRKIQKH